MSYNSKISVVTVTYHNSAGLEDTLKSLSVLASKPFEVVVVAGAFDRSEYDLVGFYSEWLQIQYLHDLDSGIYDAMNIGKSVVGGNYIHYLNAGDTIHGDPYLTWRPDQLLPVLLKYRDRPMSLMRKIHTLGHGYCHQGILFNKNHPDYDLRYKVSADIDLLISLFPRGLNDFSFSSEGHVVYDMSGVSSRRKFKRDLEILKSFTARISFFYGVKFLGYKIAKSIRFLIRGV
jgi:glycosyltransferase involved in cell wall biosynthesis